MNKKTGAEMAKPSAVPRVISVFFLLVGLLSFGLLTFMVKRDAVLALEGDVLSHINGLPDNWYLVIAAVTFLGSGWMVVATVIALYVLKRYRLAWKLALVTSVVYAVGTLAKEIIHRPRPVELFADVQVFVQETGLGFPSLHTAIATVMVLTIVMHVRRPWLYLLFIPVIVAVGLSRIYLGVHLPLDVIGGVALGLIIACLVRSLPDAWRAKSYLD